MCGNESLNKNISTKWRINKVKKSLFATLILMVMLVLPIMSQAMAPPPPPFSFPLPPPIPFVAPPQLVIVPETDVYVVPDIDGDLFFQQGWWWRYWDGRWYRSQWYDHGWDYYSGYPSWYEIILPYWRDNYRRRVWGGRSWNPPYIYYNDLDRHWRGGQWRNDHGWGHPGPGRRPDGDFRSPGPGSGPGGRHGGRHGRGPK